MDRQKYLAILRIEISDLAEDIRALQERYRGRGETGEITDYVVRENVAVLERESHGVGAALSSLDEISAESHPDLPALIAAVRSRLQERLSGFEPVVLGLVERKVAKVARYVRQDFPPG